MRHFRLTINNNFLAALAVILIIISLFNLSFALHIRSMRELSGMAPTIVGDVHACLGSTPQIIGDSYHLLTEGQLYYYDFNATGENESSVAFTDNATMFNLTSDTGIVNFTPSNADVGLHSVLITATDTYCSLENSTIVTFNITNFNDPPLLIALYITNVSGNYTYYFPINETIYFYEDAWYNLSIVAEDYDLYVPPPYQDSLRYGKIPPGLFVINTTTGNVTFMPLQSDVGGYSFRFYVIDQEDEINESGWVSVTVVNVNDPPVLENKTTLLGGLGAITTEWSIPFYYDVNATDEDGDALSFYVSFLNCTKLNASDTNCSIFGINQTSGEINFTPPFKDVGNYTVNYTVTDGQAWDWYVGSFSVSEWGNYPPNITYWLPAAYNVTISEGDSVYFFINISDDSGFPFAAWYMDSVQIDGTSGTCFNYTSDYTFVTGYEDSGIYNITVMVSDGQYVVAHEWRLIVLDTEPPTILGPLFPRRLGVSICAENWRCTAWSSCSKDGIQIRECADLSNCNTTFNRPRMVRPCKYTPNPTCFDGILNCHHGGCEILTDCGGPCASCPTCSDGILNCHVNGKCEEGVDCGGPCPPCLIPPDIPVCGNGICEAGELYECAGDCIDFWIDMLIFVVILILLIVTSILLYVYRKETVLLYIYRKMKGE